MLSGKGEVLVYSDVIYPVKKLYTVYNLINR